jgi:hypothetical protein
MQHQQGCWQRPWLRHAAFAACLQDSCKPLLLLLNQHPLTAAAACCQAAPQVAAAAAAAAAPLSQ